MYLLPTVEYGLLEGNSHSYFSPSLMLINSVTDTSVGFIIICTLPLIIIILEILTKVGLVSQDNIHENVFLDNFYRTFRDFLEGQCMHEQREDYNTTHFVFSSSGQRSDSHMVLGLLWKYLWSRVMDGQNSTGGHWRQ